MHAVSQDTTSVYNLKALYQTIQSISGNSFITAEPTQQKIKRSSPLFSDYNLDRIFKQGTTILFPESGTGRIHVLDSTGTLSRLDHTKYGGDRFGAYLFIHNDTLYSIGGYGFWHITGAIRYFDPYTKDWAPIYVNKNIPLASYINAFFFYDDQKAKLYALHGAYPDEYLTKESNPEKKDAPQIDVFDLKTKKWESQPLLITPNIAHDFSDLILVATTKQYLIVNSKRHNQTLALDLLQNQVWELAPSFMTSYVQLKDQHPFQLYSQQNTNVLLYDLNTQETYTQNIKPLLTKKLYALYTEEAPKSNPFSFLWLSIFLNILLVILLAVQLKRKPKKEYIFNNSEEQEDLLIQAKNKSFMDLLNEIEQQIVQTIAEDFKAERLTSIDKINKILGIEKRPYKIKNNLRADVLKMINKKFMDYLGNNDELIIRERSEFDKRFFEYTINERYVNKIILKKEVQS